MRMGLVLTRMYRKRGSKEFSSGLRMSSKHARLCVRSRMVRPQFESFPTFVRRPVVGGGRVEKKGKSLGRRSRRRHVISPESCCLAVSSCSCGTSFAGMRLIRAAPAPKHHNCRWSQKLDVLWERQRRTDGGGPVQLHHHVQKTRHRSLPLSARHFRAHQYTS